MPDLRRPAGCFPGVSDWRTRACRSRRKHAGSARNSMPRLPHPLSWASLPTLCGVRGDFRPPDGPPGGVREIRPIGRNPLPPPNFRPDGEKNWSCLLEFAMTSMPSRSSIQINSSLFQGSIPVNGSVPNEPSLARPMERPDSSMPMRAFLRAASSWLPSRAMSRVKVPRRSVSNPSTFSTRQPSCSASTGAITLPCRAG